MWYNCRGVPMHTKLPRTTPEHKGVSSLVLDRFVAALDRHDSLHSLIVVRNGSVIVEGWWRPYRPEVPHLLYSLSKSFTSTAVGLAVHEGLLSLDDRLVTFFPDDAPDEAGENLAAMKVRHLLAMCTGHAEEPPVFSPEGWRDPYGTFLRASVEHEPGTHFLYNTAATFMLSAILHRLTGRTLVEYLSPRLFDPLGIETPFWESSPDGVNLGGTGLYLKTEDIARFGLLYLHDGVWNGERLLPEGWVNDATRSHVANGDDPASDWNQGYGFQFWRCRNGAYRGDGAFGQYCVVLPEHDTVVAITSGVGDMQAVLNTIWDDLLPHLGPDSGVEEPSEASKHLLAERLESLAIPIPKVSAHSPKEQELSGIRWALPENATGLCEVSLDFNTNVFTYRLTGSDHPLAAGADLSGLYTTRFGRHEWVDDTCLLGYPRR
ncbi:MAG: class C beta-lactamase-related serine hydrolase, partial [Spirochaetaceae bacterium]